MLLETILGGLTGLIGNAVSAFMNYKTKKLEFNHEEKMIELETTAMIKEAEANIQIEKARIEGEVQIADAQAYMESIKQGNDSIMEKEWIVKMFDNEGKSKWITIPIASLAVGGFAIVEWLRGFMRPALTMYLTGVTTWVTWMAWDIIQQAGGAEAMTVTQSVEIFNNVTSIVVYLTVSCVTWWFGDRRLSKMLINNKGNRLSSRNDGNVNIDPPF